MTLAFYSHVACAVAYLALSALLLRQVRTPGVGLFAAMASLATALWSGAAAATLVFPPVDTAGLLLAAAGDTLEVVSTIFWLIFAGRMLGVVRGGNASAQIPRGLVLSLSLAIAVLGIVVLATEFYGLVAMPLDSQALADMLIFFGRLGLALIGLVLVENLSRNTSADQFWSIKFLCFGLGGVFAYDFFVYADAILFRHVDPELVNVRGAVNLIGAPLLAMAYRRNPNWAGGF